VQITQFATPGYTFASGINLAAGERIIVARSPAVFQSVYGASVNLAPTGYATANLSNGGERIALIGPYGDTLQDFIYDDIAPWPTSPDGGGPSLEIIEPLGDPTNPTNWRASAIAGGSPGAAAATPGDYDRNGTVQEADYNHWTMNFGRSIPATMGADGSGDGLIGAADYVVWRKFLGPPGGSGGAAQFAESATSHAAASTESISALDDSGELTASAHVLADRLVIQSPALSVRSPKSNAARQRLMASARADDRIDLVYDRPLIRSSAEKVDDFEADFALSTEATHVIHARIWSDDAWLHALAWRLNP
jgi:hypothetical protein